MCHKILLVALLMFSLVSELVSATNGATKGSVEACHDRWRLSKCIKKERRGRCDWRRTAKNCQKTCGFCTEPTTETTATTDGDSGMCTTYDYKPFKGCGLLPKSSRIIGGDEVTPHSIPWQVGLLTVFDDFKQVGCGGTLLTDKHVLTAGHCTIPFEPSDILVVVAEHHQNHSYDGERHKIRSYQNHPQYDDNTLDYDFSMLHLASPVEFGDRAIPACLPDLSFSGDKLVGKYLTVSGWGRTNILETNNDDSDYPELLQSVDLPVLSQEDCRELWASRDITNSMICADTKGGISPCHRDSGGPLTYNENGRSYLIGVVSWGIPRFCGTPGYPGVFARVTAALDWIYKELGSSC